MLDPHKPGIGSGSDSQLVGDWAWKKVSLDYLSWVELVGLPGPGGGEVAAETLPRAWRRWWRRRNQAGELEANSTSGLAYESLDSGAGVR